MYIKVYDLVSLKVYTWVRIYTAVFKCIFRVPIHPFLKKFLDTCDVGRELTPNSFFNINTFIACFFSRKIEPNIDIFWCHYKLTSTSKCAGFYSIGRKNTSQKWSKTHTKNKGFYENWFFFPPWPKYCELLPMEILKKNSKLDPSSSKIYKNLNTPHSQSYIC